MRIESQTSDERRPFLIFDGRRGARRPSDPERTSGLVAVTLPDDGGNGLALAKAITGATQAERLTLLTLAEHPRLLRQVENLINAVEDRQGGDSTTRRMTRRVESLIGEIEKGLR